jgi:hypothetical protein
MTIIKQVFCGFLLLGIGWTVGHADRAEPEFMLAIDAPFGSTRVECLSGCVLMGANDLGNPNAGTMSVYTYGCSGRAAANSDARCEAQVAGWIGR